MLAAGEQATAASLLSEGVVRENAPTNPATVSALDIDEIRPELFADAPEFLLPLAAELLWRGAFGADHGPSRSPGRNTSTRPGDPSWPCGWRW